MPPSLRLSGGTGNPYIPFKKDFPTYFDKIVGYIPVAEPLLGLSAVIRLFLKLFREEFDPLEHYNEEDMSY